MEDKEKDIINPEDEDVKDPEGQPENTEGNSGEDNTEGLVKKNRELLGELKKIKEKLRKFESEKEKELKKKLEEEKKYEELLELEKKNNEKIKQRVMIAELKAEAVKQGLVDDDYIEILAKRVTFNEELKPENVEELFTELKEKKPYLFNKQVGNAGVDNGSGGSGYKSNIKFTPEQIARMTPEEYEKQREAIISSIAKKT